MESRLAERVDPAMCAFGQNGRRLLPRPVGFGYILCAVALDRVALRPASRRERGRAMVHSDVHGGLHFNRMLLQDPGIVIPAGLVRVSANNLPEAGSVLPE